MIERSCALREITDRVELNRRIAGASALPSVPRLYVQLTELLRSGDGSADDAAKIVERDIAMAAKMLQLANSAYFGRRNPVTGCARPSRTSGSRRSERSPCRPRPSVSSG